MVAKMSEQQARETLTRIGSPAADPVEYEARRVRGGWSFRWREGSGPFLLGTIGWVVADNGECGGQHLGMTAEETVQALMEDRS